MSDKSSSSKPPKTKYKVHSSSWASRDLNDFDYWDKLKGADLDWLQRFSEEYYDSRFQPKGQLHNTKKLKLEVYSANNARKRTMEVGHVPPIPADENRASQHVEDALIDWIDWKYGKK